MLAVIISGFWCLDSLKDPILSRTVGMENQPFAKLLSVICTVLIVSVYDFLTSTLSKPNLFLCISGAYGGMFFLISALLSDPDVGLENKVKNDFRFLGYISYVAIESYGSLMVALFWSFTNSSVNLELAKVSDYLHFYLTISHAHTHSHTLTHSHVQLVRRVPMG